MAALNPVTMRPLSGVAMCDLLKAYFAGPGADLKDTVQPALVEADAECYPGELRGAPLLALSHAVPRSEEPHRVWCKQVAHVRD